MFPGRSIDEVTGETPLVLPLDGEERFEQFLALSMRGNVNSGPRPAASASRVMVRRDARQVRIRVEKPPTGCNPVRLVVEPLGEKLVEVRQQLVLDEFRVKLRDSVDAMGPECSEVGHAHVLDGPLLDDRGAIHARRVHGPSSAHLSHESMVEFVDDHHVPRKHAP